VIVPANVLLPLAAVLFFAVVGLFVVEFAVYRRIVRRLKDRNSPLVASGDRSSRWALWRFLWTQQDRTEDHSIGSLLKTFRIVSVAYVLATLVWLVLLVLILLPR
jgi:hypothetical protein